MKPALRLFGAILAGALGISRCGAQSSWHDENGFRWADLEIARQGRTGFTLLSPEQTGITFTNVLEGRAGESNRVLLNGSGVAVGDFDNDGRPDIYFCSLNGQNALYKNLGGMKFKDVTAGSGIVCRNRFCTGAVFADINGDGWLDLLVATTGSGVLCFLNDGHGKFSDATPFAGTATRYGSATMALADVDGNGTLDLYVANYRTDDIRDRGQVDLEMVRGKLSVPPALQDRLLLVNGRLLEYGEPDMLYLNDGRGHFTPVSWTDGAFLDEEGKRLTNAPLDWGLTATFRDLNGDGYPDLYVCNDFLTPDRVWINDGRGHFRAIDKLALRSASLSSMGVDFADLTRSGKLDFFVADMLSPDLRARRRQKSIQSPAPSTPGLYDNRPQIARNTLFQDRGDGAYAEIGNYAGLPASGWSWSPVFLDVDLDGYPDLLIASGYPKDVQDLDTEARMRTQNRPRNQNSDPQKRLEAFIDEKVRNATLYPRLDGPVAAFHNLGNYQFAEATALWGTDQPGVHNSIAFADLDGDGDLDLVVNNLNGVAGIYRNESAAPRVAVRLKGLSPNTQGIGAKIKLLGGAVPMQSEEVISGGRYLAGSDPMLVFAAGHIADGMTIEVSWRKGTRSIIHGVKANRIYEIDEAGARDFKAPARAETRPLFEDVSGLISHAHHEEEFNDFERQPLLPRKLSQLGPGAAWADLDGDGWDDLIIGSGKGGRLAVCRNDGRGGFQRMTGAPFDALAPRDQSGIIVWQNEVGQTVILAGSANYEDGLTTGSGIQQYDLGRKVWDDSLPARESSTGPLAVADIDGSGNLALFVGGRVLPGRYPEAASSAIYRRQGNQWAIDESNTRVFEKIGLVSGAVWSDLDGDGYPELIVACEWGPVRVFKNQTGRLRDITAELGLDKYTGWWNGVTTGDLDGDGRMDIIAANWGLNTPYHATPEHPASVYYGDFAERGAVGLIETEYDPALNALAPRRLREALSWALPDLAARFPTHKAFSESTIAQVLGEHQAQARELQASALASMVFFNRGDHFEAKALPIEAQWAPAFSVNVADFDGDGHEDVFLSQNFFANRPEVPRYDAGRGLLLLGDGAGILRAMPGQESGIRVYGEQRGAAVGDFDQDGRADLVVTQNGAETRLFRNVGAKPGLRVRLIGAPGNPRGIGAQLRLLFGKEAGPMRELHCGSGYWSQDSAIAVLGAPQPPVQLWIRWPGGAVTTTDLLKGVKEITVNREGKLVKSR
jgi:hypothetical protein